MPTVRKTDPPAVTVRGVGSFNVGDTADVDADAAAYLVDDRGDFAYVDGPADGDVHEEDGPPDNAIADMTYDQLYQMAQAENVDGRSEMSKDDLIAALSED